MAPFPRLGDGFLLRTMKPDDVNPLADIEFDPEVKRFLALPELKRDEWIRDFNHASHGGLAIEVDGNLAGRCSFHHYNTRVRGYKEIAVIIGRSWWGKGLGRKVAELMIEIAFDHPSTKGVVGIVHPEHRASIALLLSFGFRNRGVVQKPAKAWQEGHLVYRLPRRGA